MIINIIGLFFFRLFVSYPESRYQFYYRIDRYKEY